MSDKGSVNYICVLEEEDDEVPIEVPLEPDGTLLLSTLAGLMPGACGLKYRNEKSGSYRGLRIENLKIYPPDGRWPPNVIFSAVFPKDKKRKMVEFVNSCGLTKFKKIDWLKCSDLIVLGLPYNLQEESMRSYFSKFGDIVMLEIKRDSKTGRSKGYGFIRFLEYESQCVVMSTRHEIEGRMCDVKIPNSKCHSDPSKSIMQRVFIGGLTEAVGANELKQFFATLGTVLDVFIPRPFRGYGFLTFAETSVAQGLCGKEFTISGVCVRCSYASPKNSSSSLAANNSSHDLAKEAQTTNSPNSSGLGRQTISGKQGTSRAWMGHVASPVMACGEPGSPSCSLSATNQATVGMGALNLGSLLTPAVWAAAQAAIINTALLTPAPSAAQPSILHTGEFNPLLGPFQPVSNNNCAQIPLLNSAMPPSPAPVPCVNNAEDLVSQPPFVNRVTNPKATDEWSSTRPTAT